MEDSRFRKINICTVLIFLISQWSNCVPTIEGVSLGEHIRKRPENEEINSSARQGAISNWIQNIPFTPLGVNVPGIISNTSSGVQQVVAEGFQNASSTVGQGFQNFGQGIKVVGETVGNGIKNFGQALGEGYQAVVSNLGERFPLVNRLPGVNQVQSIPELTVVSNNSSNELVPELSSNSS